MTVSQETGATERTKIFGAVTFVAEDSKLVQAIAANGTITPVAGQSLVRTSAAGAVTGIIIAAGTNDGDLLIVLHTSAAANTLTFAAKATSNVMGGAAISVAGLSAHVFIWSSIDSAWYQVGPVAN